MAPISKDTWKEILRNQKLPLIGTKEPHNGNGYHNRISWSVTYRWNNEDQQELYDNTFFNVNLRDLGYAVNLSLKDEDKIIKGLNLKSCTKEYKETFFKYFGRDRFYNDNLLDELGRWGEGLCYTGRLIFEIVGWFDNDSGQFYGYMLHLLENRFCKIRSKNVIYKAPVETNEGNVKFKKVNIPISKCIIINFPSEYGGYKGFWKKINEITKLGEQFLITPNAKANIEHTSVWNKKFNKIVSNWGFYNNQVEATEFYKEYCAFRYKRIVILCTHELIKGLKTLIIFLNKKLQEDAILEFDLKEYDINYFNTMEQKWSNGELSFKEANSYLKL